MIAALERLGSLTEKEATTYREQVTNLFEAIEGGAPALWQAAEDHVLEHGREPEYARIFGCFEVLAVNSATRRAVRDAMDFYK